MSKPNLAWLTDEAYAKMSLSEKALMWAAHECDVLKVQEEPKGSNRGKRVDRPYDVVKKGSERAYPPSKEGLLKDFPFDDYQNQELHFKVFRDYCDKYKVQPWLSETGCHRDVPGRLQYAKDIKGLGEKYNIPICWWAFRDEYGANPRYYDPKRGTVLERDHYYWETITTI